MAEDQQFYRQFLQSTGPDGSQTVREIVSPNLLDAAAAAAAEQQAGRTFSGFVAPDKMAGVGRAPAAPPPPPAPTVPPLPSDVTPTSGIVPTAPQAQRAGAFDAQIRGALEEAGAPTSRVAAPGSSPWLNAIPPFLAAAGPTALAIAQPEIGIPLWIAQAGLAGLGGGGGEAIREKLAGEELSPSNIAEQAAVSSGAEAGIQKVGIPLATRVVQGLGGRIFPTLGAVRELGPVLSETDAAATAAPRVGELANAGADAARSATEPAFHAARVAGAGLPVSTAGLEPYATAASDAVARAGATPDQVAEFGTVVRPMVGNTPTDYVQLAGRERQLENWVSGMRAQGAAPTDVAAVEQLHRAVGSQLDAAAAGTPAAPMRAQYVAVQGDSLPTRYGLSDLQSNTATLAAPANRPAFQTVVAQASEAERPALAAAWVDSARQAAAQSGNPVTYMRAAYEALGPDTQTALFGAQKGAFEHVLNTAWGGTGGEITHLAASAAGFGGAGAGASHLALPFHVPGLAMTRAVSDAATPFLAKGALMNPPVAAFGGTLSRVAGQTGQAVTRLGGQAVAERARQTGLPTF
jgi:hypothetical protein